MFSEWLANRRRRAEGRRREAEERQRHDDAAAHAAWRTIKHLIPNELPREWETKMAGYVLDERQRIRSGRKMWMRFSGSLRRQDTFWRNAVTPPMRKWVVFTGSVQWTGTHSGEPVIHVRELLEVHDGQIEKKAQRHEERLAREHAQAKTRPASVPPPTS
jgi:hypothetical protein